jgi:hypothetical protein
VKSLAYAAAAAVALTVLAVPSAAAEEPHYANCAEVREAGKAPLHKDQPGYEAKLDRDNDGVACETDEPSGTKVATTSKPSATKVAVAQSVDPCSVMSEQAAGKLRTLAGPMLPEAAKDLPDSVIVTVARAKAKCTGTPPALSEAELTKRLCALATVEELRKLGARLGAADQAKAKATDGNVKAIQAKLGCDKGDDKPTSTTNSTTATSTSTKKPTSPTSDNPRGRTSIGKGGGYSQVGDRDVPVGSIATGG